METNGRLSRIKIALDGLRGEARKLDVLVSNLIASDSPNLDQIEELASVAGNISQLTAQIRGSA